MSTTIKMLMLAAVLFDIDPEPFKLSVIKAAAHLELTSQGLAAAQIRN